MPQVGQVFAVADMTVLFTAVKAEHSDISGFCESDHLPSWAFWPAGGTKKQKKNKTGRETRAKHALIFHLGWKGLWSWKYSLQFHKEEQPTAIWQPWLPGNCYCVEYHLQKYHFKRKWMKRGLQIIPHRRVRRPFFWSHGNDQYSLLSVWHLHFFLAFVERSLAGKRKSVSAHKIIFL